jgi:hypothetical protein
LILLVEKLEKINMKNKLLLLAMVFALKTQMILTQLPFYVPTIGLIGD